ncbi:MAG: hypothetical protein IJJ57_04045 [Ruminococcus sp.]|nr:hypothetical protein [Ruminococcus sp.]
MKNNDIEKLFSSISDEAIEKIAEDYPTGDKKQRDRIYKEVERRVGKDITVSGDEVKGVEKYRSRPYLRFVSAAATLIIAAGAVGGGSYLISSRKNITSEPSVPSSDVSENTAATEPVTEAEPIPVEESVPTALTKDEIIEKINNRSYETYDKLSIRYVYTRCGGASTESGIAKRDGITGNESFSQQWTHTADYFPQSLIDEYGLDELMKEESVGNDMFFYNDLLITIFSNDTGEPSQYEVTDRSNWPLDEPTVFRGLCSEDIAVDLDLYDIDDDTVSTEFLSRPCTEVRLSVGSKEKQERLKEKYGLPDAIEVPEISGATDSSHGDILEETVITVDNETGFILKFVTTCGEEIDEYKVEEILFNDDAENVESGAEIREKLKGCVPNNEITAAYDLSVLDEN